MLGDDSGGSGTLAGAIMAAPGLLTSMLSFTDADCALMARLYTHRHGPNGTARRSSVTGDAPTGHRHRRLFSAPVVGVQLSNIEWE